MPVEVFEKHAGRHLSTGPDSHFEEEWIARGSTVEGDIVTAILTAADATKTVDGKILVREGISRLDELTDVQAGWWEVTVRYRQGGVVALAVGQSAFSFNTSGGTQHIKQSKA